MSVLTKVFVVVVAVLSVVLVALVVPFVARTEDYRDLLKNSKAENDVLNATARNAQAALADEIKSVDKISKDSQVMKEQMDATIQDLHQKLAATESKLEEEQAKEERNSADLAGLASAETQHAEITKALQAELTQRRDEVLREQKSRVDLAAANDRLESDLEAAKRQLSRFQEQITLLDEKNADLEGELAKIPSDVLQKVTSTETGDNTVAYESPVPIKGQVTRVQKVDDSTFVQVNVGSADGVAKNMKFWFTVATNCWAPW